MRCRQVQQLVDFTGVSLTRSRVSDARCRQGDQRERKNFKEGLSRPQPRDIVRETRVPDPSTSARCARARDSPSFLSCSRRANAAFFDISSNGPSTVPDALLPRYPTAVGHGNERPRVRHSTSAGLLEADFCAIIRWWLGHAALSCSFSNSTLVMRPRPLHYGARPLTRAR
jgi:hypothetical protein